ncbi:hypothetical protein ASD56_02685 [Microbacterium sp. Root166]|nr:hypothetical protein ASD56_02685 [Microbacterium sp. Root166]
MWSHLAAEVQRLDADDSVRVIEIRGDGSDFSTGVDLVAAWADRQGVNPSELTTDAERAITHAQTPTVAVLRGQCVGGGAMIACACDFRLASSTSSIAVTPARFGVIYPSTSVRRLAHLCGPSVAKRLLIASEVFSAHDARAARLVDWVHSDDELDAAVEAFCAKLAELAPLSQAAAKEFIDGLGPAEETPLEATQRWERAAGSDPEQRARLLGFLQRKRG